MRRVLAAALLTLAALPAGAAAAPCEPERCRAFPAAAGAGGAIVSGPDGALWFTGDGFVGRMTLAGAVTRVAAPVSSGSDLARGADGAVWATAGGGRLARITPDGQVSLHATGLDSGPTALAGAPDGAMWFAHVRTVGWVTAGGRGARHELPLPWPYQQQYGAYRPAPPPGVFSRGGLTLGRDGAMWVVDHLHFLYRVAADGTAGVRGNGGGSGPAELAAGPDGGLWLVGPGTQWVHNRTVTRTSPATGRTTVYGASRRPAHLVAGPSHSLWFTLTGAPPTIVRLTPSGFQTFFQLDGGPLRGLAVGADGQVYATRGEEGIVRLSPFLGAYPIRTRVLAVNTFAGATSIRLFCPKFDLIFCAGRLTLRHRGRVIGGAPFSHRVNDAPATRIVLNARGRRLTRRPGRRRVRLTIDQHDQGGTRRRSVQNVYLRTRR